MSLLLNGSKTITIAGTEMQCIEIYTGEAYTFPFNFTDSLGDPINTTGWTLGTTAKFYVADTISYSSTNTTEINIGNLTLTSPQPSTGAGTLLGLSVCAWLNSKNKMVNTSNRLFLIIIKLEFKLRNDLP